MGLTSTFGPLRSSGRPARAAGIVAVIAWVAVGLVPSGCGPSEEQIRLLEAMHGVRTNPKADFDKAVNTLATYREDDKHRSEFVQYSMCEVTAAALGGRYEHANTVGKHAYMAVKKYVDAGAETRAAWGNEAIKFFKGEPHERAMLCFYIGLMCYIEGDYNNARIFFAQSLHSTATRDEDMADFREDFRLGHYWLGRAFLRLGQADNARIAFGKAAVSRPLPGEEKKAENEKAARARAYKTQLELEKKCYEQGTNGKSPVAGIVDLSKPVSREAMPATLAGTRGSPPVTATTVEAFLDPAFQQGANLIVLLELGTGPLKYLKGSSGSIDDYRCHECMERSVDVYVDGVRGGPAFVLIDMCHQAMTRGVKTRRGRQVGKAIAKEILTRAPLVGGLFSYWDIGADSRFWPSLPDRVAVFAAQVPPGFHDLSLRFYDINGAYLPRFDVNRHYIYVPETGERIVLLHSVENQDNAYILAQTDARK